MVDSPNTSLILRVSEQRDLLTKLRNIAKGTVPPDGDVYEQIGNVDIIRFSGAGRADTKVVTFIPSGDTSYHISYLLYVDEGHEYDQAKLGKFSHQAQQKLETITDLDAVEDVEAYLAAHNSLTADDLDDLLDE